MKVYEIRGRKIYKQWGMKFVDWCKINGFEYMIEMRWMRIIYLTIIILS